MRKSAFQPSEATRRRVWEHEQLEHLLILAKAKARSRNAHG